MAAQAGKFAARFLTHGSKLSSAYGLLFANYALRTNVRITSNIKTLEYRMFSDARAETEKESRPSKQIEDIARVQPKQFSLRFEEYLKLKRNLRVRQRVAGLPFAIVGLGTSSVVSAYMFPEMFDATPENVQLIMGLDPLVFCGICGVVSAGIGYAMGTQLFKSFWGLMNKEKATMLSEREADFLERIQNHRFASFSKFEDDYYGESIKNLSDYRQWLRTQQKKAAADEKFIREKEAKENEENRT